MSSNAHPSTASPSKGMTNLQNHSISDVVSSLAPLSRSEPRERNWSVFDMAQQVLPLTGEDDEDVQNLENLIRAAELAKSKQHTHFQQHVPEELGENMLDLLKGVHMGMPSHHHYGSNPMQTSGNYSVAAHSSSAPHSALDLEAMHTIQQQHQQLMMLQQQQQQNHYQHQQQPRHHTNTHEHSDLNTMNIPVQSDKPSSPQQKSSQGPPPAQQKYADGRKGKWSDEEQHYALAIIKFFQDGVLAIAAGSTLRSFLAEKLHCDPMRVSKKLSGTHFAGIEIPKKMGKRTYVPTKTILSASEKNEIYAELTALEAAFVRRIEEDERLEQSAVQILKRKRKLEKFEKLERSGPWLLEEEEYSFVLVKYFLEGLLDIPQGTTLRSFLAEKLRCDPMRISKKISAGKLCHHPIPRRVGTRSFMAKVGPYDTMLLVAARDELTACQDAFFEATGLVKNKSDRPEPAIFDELPTSIDRQHMKEMTALHHQRLQHHQQVQQNQNQMALQQQQQHHHHHHHHHQSPYNASHDPSSLDSSSFHPHHQAQTADAAMQAAQILEDSNLLIKHMDHVSPNTSSSTSGGFSIINTGNNSNHTHNLMSSPTGSHCPMGMEPAAEIEPEIKKIRYC